MSLDILIGRKKQGKPTWSGNVQERRKMWWESYTNNALAGKLQAYGQKKPDTAGNKKKKNNNNNNKKQNKTKKKQRNKNKT